MNYAVINDIKLFPTVYRRIYCRKFLTLSNQISRYKTKCIRILYHLSIELPISSEYVPIINGGSGCMVIAGLQFQFRFVQILMSHYQTCRHLYSDGHLDNRFFCLTSCQLELKFGVELQSLCIYSWKSY